MNVELDLMDSEWYELMKLAHQYDITLNELCNAILRDHIKDITAEYQVAEQPTAREASLQVLLGETARDLK